LQAEALFASTPWSPCELWEQSAVGFQPQACDLSFFSPHHHMLFIPIHTYILRSVSVSATLSFLEVTFLLVNEMKLEPFLPLGPILFWGHLFFFNQIFVAYIHISLSNPKEMSLSSGWYIIQWGMKPACTEPSWHIIFHFHFEDKNSLVVM
jgi:hypothetical protein